MTMQDPMSDMLTRIRNAQQAGIAAVTMPSSNLKVSVAQVLQEEGYIESHQVTQGEGGKADLSITLRYHEGKPVIEEISRMSRPGLRQYKAKDEIPQVKGGLGVIILTTNRGVMTDRTARAAGIGGEILCSVF
ncbi:MAG: 30S ribosomal protein S8 [Gammaproteobacteria bacterium]|jgi:small subunit ribosomal protein S8|nr:30S ribosomal protein S8 [Gammaproteobacteria bacterium]MBT4492547.1 30S ribosomal protein S8 [Gammaproteobacteria bacterium]MBT7370651.1 30S ribosomal protein S8 [Gammaproteobacteria bacterium]